MVLYTKILALEALKDKFTTTSTTHPWTHPPPAPWQFWEVLPQSPVQDFYGQAEDYKNYDKEEDYSASAEDENSPHHLPSAIHQE